MGTIGYATAPALTSWGGGPSRMQFQWRAAEGPGQAPPEPYRVMRALRSFAKEHGLRLQEHKELLGHFHAPWVTIWEPGAHGAMVVAVRHWAARVSGDEAHRAVRGNHKEVILDVSVDSGLDWSRRCALWNMWRAFPELAPVWDRGANWHSSADRRLRDSFIPEPPEIESKPPGRRTLYYWER